MFYYLEGTVSFIESNLVVIDCGGIGFTVNTTANSIAKVRIGDSARLYTHCVIREDAFDIYGFISRQELKSFKLLISVTGVGPKAALAILSAVSPDGLTMAVLTQNEKMLTAAQGIGKKIAQRIILELKDKLGDVNEIDVAAANTVAVPVADASSSLSEAIQALQALGYDQSFINKAVKGLDTQNMSVQDIIRYALKQAIS